ncbi:uncharacterized protein FFNC_15651 [Fusarium fujikuroi]|nr:uncharacterized protein FFNC_15651 [Fusarium fujikuroi]
MAPTCEYILQDIITNLKVPLTTYEKHFPGTSKSKRFLWAARQLSSKCKDWISFKNLLEEASSIPNGL